MFNNCDAIFKDPFFKGRKCGKKAKYIVKMEGENDYLHYRCGTHAKKEDKIELYNKKVKNTNKEEHKKKEENNFDFNELLKYIESEKWKKEIPQEIQNLFNEIDNLNNNIEKITNNFL